MGERLPVCFFVVGDRGQALDLGAGRGELRLEQDRIGFIDLSGQERLARWTKLAPGRHDGGARPPRHRDLRPTRRCEGGELRSSEPGPSLDHDVVSVHVTPGGTHIGPGLDARAISIVLS